MKVLKILFFCLLLPVAVIADVPRLKLVVTSDIHGQWKILEKVYAFAAGKNPDAVLFCGDLAIRHGDADSYKTYIALFKKHFSKPFLFSTKKMTFPLCPIDAPYPSIA